MTSPTVLSHLTVVPLLEARQGGESSAVASLDLGLTKTEVLLGPEGVELPGGQRLSWTRLEEIGQNESVCYLVRDNDAEKIQRFSEYLDRFYSLMPTQGAPTLLISGVLMHRIKGIDPYHDTLRKTPEADRQGAHRLARGRTFFSLGAARADALGVDFGWRLQEVPGAAHSNAWVARSGW